MGTLYSNEIVGRCTSFLLYCFIFNWCLEWGQLKSWSVISCIHSAKMFPSLSIYQARHWSPPPHLTIDGSTYGNFFRHPFHSHLQTDNQNVITVSTLGSHRSKWATRKASEVEQEAQTQRGREWQRGEIRTGERGTDGGPVEWRLRLDSSLRYPDLIRWPITVTLANHLMSMSFTTGSATQSLTFPFSPYYRHQSKAVFY